ncbi:hypothetical protein D3C84_1187570 [compost metagenome]
MAATANAIEQEVVIGLALRQLLAPKRQPGVEFVEGPGRRVLDQLLVALAQHLQAALVEIDLAQVEVDRLGFAHAGAVQQGDHRRIT